MGLSRPWTYGRGDSTSEEQRIRFQTDPDLIMMRQAPEWRKAYAEVIRLVEKYWKEYFKRLRVLEGPNKPLVRVDKEAVGIGRNEPSTSESISALERMRH